MQEVVTPRKRNRAGYMRLYRTRQVVERDEDGLLGFQTRFISAICRKENPVSLAGLSTARANGKSWLAGYLIAKSITPGDPLHEDGIENVLVASSRQQAAIVLNFARNFLGEEGGYRWRLDGCEHLASRARVRIISSDSRRAMGLGANVRLVVCDEPGSWAPQSGRRLWEAVTGAIGKRKTTVIAIGTLAPSALTGPASWWPQFISAGSGEGRHISLLQADPEKWESFDEVLRVNPVSLVNKYLLDTLKREHKAALESERAARTFRQYRLNIPGDPVEAQPLITSAEWERIVSRPVPPCEGRPVVGVDLGGTRSWSAACALWPSGRISSWAIAPGQPSLADQEREDQVPEDSYTALVRSGGLAVDEGRAVPDIEVLLARVWAWSPSCIVCDPFRSKELHQVIAGRTRIVERSHGESTSNVQSLRSLLLDSSAGVTLNSRALLEAAFMQTNLVIDNSGVTRVSKVDRRRSRDDAAAALLLACGEKARRPAPVELRGAIISREGLVTWI